MKWGDQDPYQHANNTVYFKYQESARLGFFRRLLGEVDAGAMDKDAYMGGTGIGPILSDTYCKFKFPLTYPDKLLVGATIKQGDWSKDRYKLSHAIWSLQHGRVVSEGYGTVVSYDYSKGKVVDMPEPLVHAIERLHQKDSLHLLNDHTVTSPDFSDV